jgi:MoxR-like ATPase
MLSTLGDERRFFDDGRMVDIPLSTMLCMANSIPAPGHNLAAVWDRVHHRIIVEELTDPEDMRRMFATDWDPAPAKLLTLADLHAAQAAAATVPITPEADEALIEVVVQLAKEGILVSSRKKMQARRIGSAAAWLDGATKVLPGHLSFLQHMLWDRVEQRPTVAKIVLGAVAPNLDEVRALVDSVATLAEEVEELRALDRKDKKRIEGASEVYGKVKREALNLVELEQKAVGTAARAELARAERAIVSVNTTAMTELMNFDEPTPIMDAARAGKLRVTDYEGA